MKTFDDKHPLPWKVIEVVGGKAVVIDAASGFIGRFDSPIAAKCAIRAMVRARLKRFIELGNNAKVDLL